MAEDRQVTHSDDLGWWVKLYQEWQRDGYAGTIVQGTPEDTGLGVQECTIENIFVTSTELKHRFGADFDPFLRVRSGSTYTCRGLHRACAS